MSINLIHMPAGVCTVLSFLGIVMASSMKCIGHDSSTSSMFVTSCPIPVLKAGEVLIKVRVVGECTVAGLEGGHFGVSLL